VSVSQSDIDAAVELFSGLGDVSTRKMMGGLCLYSDGAIFAILSSDGRVYLKAKGAFADRLAAEGAEIFSYDFGTGKGAGSMGYWTLPDAALDDPDLACDWARQALEAAGG
jgi:DNA transformation protein